MFSDKEPPADLPTRIATEVCGSDAVRKVVTDADQLCAIHGTIQEIAATQIAATQIAASQTIAMMFKSLIDRIASKPVTYGYGGPSREEVFTDTELEAMREQLASQAGILDGLLKKAGDR